VLSSAIAVFIGKGLPVEKAVEKAKLFVEKMLKTAKPVGRARRSISVLNIGPKYLSTQINADNL